MTTEMQEHLERLLDSAKTPEEIDRAMIASMKALIDCQRKTAERVKTLAAERERESERRKGALWLWRFLTATAGAGGGAYILKALGVLHL